MNESINTTAAPIGPSGHYEPSSDDEIELPSKAEVGRWIKELEENGVPAELLCHECSATVETKVPPEAKDDKNQETICRDCMTDHLLERGLL